MVTRSIWIKGAVSVLGLLAAVGNTSEALAAGSGERALGFSNLVLRVENSSGIAIAPDEFRVHLLERLRELGLNAVGAESVVFAKDEQDKAEVVLGGTIRQLECQDVERRVNCRIGVRWELLDVALDKIVYEVTTTHAVFDVSREDHEGTGKALVLGALESLAKRDKFRDQLRAAPKPEAAPTYAEATFRGCATAAQPMPASASDAIRATAIVETGRGFGSGFFLNEEGLVVTAAHVVESGGATIRLRDGTTFQALLIRSNRLSDVALLRPETPQKTACLQIGERRDLLGADVYAIGSPASRELAFSVTRGIVSGARSFDGVEFWQTDASINQGNSGGPLLTSDGKVFAIASWKIVGSAVEGIAFGAPILPGLKALGLTPGDATAAALSEAKALGDVKKASTASFVDEEDEAPSLDPEGERRRELELAELERQHRDRERERREDAERDRLTPTYVKAMKYGGPVLAGAGVIGALVSAQGYSDGSTTEPEYQRLRLTNDLSWVAIGVGSAAFVLSFVLTPEVKLSEAKKASISVAVGGNGLSVRGRY